MSTFEVPPKPTAEQQMKAVEILADLAKTNLQGDVFERSVKVGLMLSVSKSLRQYVTHTKGLDRAISYMESHLNLD